jgi:DnaJ-domain-containing protein 1
MFERGLSNMSDRTKVAAALTLTSGECLTVQISVSGGARILDMLNRPEAFIEAEGVDGTSRILLKQTIASLTPISVPKADELSRSQKTAVFDPLAILGLSPGANAEQIRAAFLQRVKAYHPDKFAGLGLPREVEDYAASMLQRINAAYQALAPRTMEAA